MNWGNKLLLAFIVFGAGMFYLVYRSVNTDYQLVEKEYYKSELRYQQVIDGTSRANGLISSVELANADGVIRLQLPPEMKNKEVTGEVWFYCSYNEKKDKRVVLDINEQALQEFQQGFISPGNYTVKISWSAEGKSYYAEKLLSVL
ncbi:MAG: FixH family protein [Bacteroidota bacterium]